MSEGKTPEPKSPLLFSAQLKRVLFLYVVGTIIALQGTSLVEWLVDSRLLLLQKALLVTLVIPGGASVRDHTVHPTGEKCAEYRWGSRR